MAATAISVSSLSPLHHIRLVTTVSLKQMTETHFVLQWHRPTCSWIYRQGWQFWLLKVRDQLAVITFCLWTKCVQQWVWQTIC